jgi:hypothetical protein
MEIRRIERLPGRQERKNRDLCINESLLSAIAADIAREKPDFLFVSGDLVNGWFKNSGVDYAAQYAAWKKIMTPVYRAGVKIYTIRGNHDDGPERVVLPPLPARFEPAPGDLERLKTAYMEAFGAPCPRTDRKRRRDSLTASFIKCAHHRAGYVCRFTARINQKWLDTVLAASRKASYICFWT